MRIREPASARKLQRLLDALGDMPPRRANPPPRIDYNSFDSTKDLTDAVLAADMIHGDSLVARAAVSCALDVVREADSRGLIDTDIIDPLLAVAEDALEDALSYDEFGRRVSDILAAYNAPRRFGGHEYDVEWVRGAARWTSRCLSEWATESPDDGRRQRVAISAVVSSAIHVSGAALTRDIRFGDSILVFDCFHQCRLAWVSLGYPAADAGGRVLERARNEISRPTLYDIVEVVVGATMDDAAGRQKRISSFSTPTRILRDACNAMYNGLIAALGGSEEAHRDVAQSWVIRKVKRTHGEFQFPWVAARYARACVSVLRARGLTDRAEEVVLQPLFRGLIVHLGDLVRDGADESVGGGHGARFITGRYDDKFSKVNGRSMSAAWFDYAVSMARRNEYPDAPSAFGRKVLEAARSAPMARALAKTIGVKAVPPWRPSRPRDA